MQMARIWDGPNHVFLNFCKAVIESDKPHVNLFRRCVTHEVLPVIRKTGGYIHKAADMSCEKIMSKDDRSERFLSD